MNDSKMSTSLPLAFRGDTPVSIQVQSILYNNRASDVKRALQSLARSAELAMRAGVCRQVLVRYGDSSQMPCFRDDEVAELQREFGSAILIEYVHFGANLGSAGGHNRLAKDSTSDFFLIQNPDVVVCPRIFQLLLEPFANRGVGLVEAKQLPIEHPKEYNVSTGETSWAATACALVPRSLYEQIGGFDSASFFLYCDDVDFSWSIRLAGYQVIYQPAAVVFHDKRLTADGKWQPTTSELYFSAEAALILAYKWSRADLADKILEYFDVAPEPHYSRAAAEYRKRLVDGKLPKPVDSENKIAQFIDGNYATHRYAL